MLTSLLQRKEEHFCGNNTSLHKHAYVIFCNLSQLKNDNFQMKKCDIFLIFAQNIDRGYTLERRF